MDWDRILRADVLAIIMGCTVAIVAIVAHYWHQNAKSQSESELKRSMIERGMTVDEIERVIAASSGTDASRHRLSEGDSRA